MRPNPFHLRPGDRLALEQALEAARQGAADLASRERVTGLLAPLDRPPVRDPLTAALRASGPLGRIDAAIAAATSDTTTSEEP